MATARLHGLPSIIQILREQRTMSSPADDKLKATATTLLERLVALVDLCIQKVKEKEIE